MSTAKQYQVYIPTGSGAADTFALLRSGDIIDLVDNELGPLQVEFYREMDTNRPIEYARYRNGEASELVLQVTEEAAKGIDRLRVSDCPLPVQRRLCGVGGHWQEVEHYGLVQYGQRGGSGLTAVGTDARDDLPAVRFPGTYRSGERYFWDKTEPIQYDKGVGDNNAPVGIVYCDEPGCENCGTGCQRLFALTTNGVDEWVLETSADGGHSWETVATGLAATAVGQAIYCYYGRVFLAFASGTVFYSDTPLVSGSWVAADLSDIPVAIPAARFIRFAHPRKSHIKVIYALYSAGGDTNGVAMSYDNGATWDDIVTAGVDVSDPTYYDIAAAGSWVAVIGVDGANGEISYSNDLGETFTTFEYNIGGNTTGVAIAMDLPNPFEVTEPVVYILSKSSAQARHILHKTSGDDLATSTDWTMKWAAALVSATPGSPQFNLYTTAAGYLLWVHIPNIAGGIAYILKSIDGGGSFVDMRQTITMDDASGDRFAVCPQDGNQAILLGGDITDEP